MGRAAYLVRSPVSLRKKPRRRQRLLPVTTVDHRAVICGVCTTESVQAIMTSTSAFGASDLDMRPPEPQRSALWLAVQRCPSCGFRASSLEAGDEDLRELMDAGYDAVVADESLPELARDFLGAAWIAEHRGDERAAAWDAVKAAWVCDDAGEVDGARRCRDRAVELIELGAAEGDQLVDDLDAEAAVKADLLRRAGRFDEASECAREALDEGADDSFLRRLLEYQLELVRRSDDAARTTDDAPENGEARRRAR